MNGANVRLNSPRANSLTRVRNKHRLPFGEPKMGNFVTDLRVRWPNVHSAKVSDFEQAMANDKEEEKKVMDRLKPGEWASDNILYGFGEFQEEMANEFDPGSTRIMHTYDLELRCRVILTS